MSETEFDRLLDVVRSAVAPVHQEDLLLHCPHILTTPQPGIDGVPCIAANDNRGPWPLVPFPDGWFAAC